MRYGVNAQRVVRECGGGEDGVRGRWCGGVVERPFCIRNTRNGLFIIQHGSSRPMAGGCSRSWINTDEVPEGAAGAQSSWHCTGNCSQIELQLQLQLLHLS
jgi:hypothetical protein